MQPLSIREGSTYDANTSYESNTYDDFLAKFYIFQGLYCKAGQTMKNWEPETSQIQVLYVVSPITRSPLPALSLHNVLFTVKQDNHPSNNELLAICLV